MVVIACSFGCFFACAQDDGVSLQFRLAETEPTDGAEKFDMEGSGQAFYLHSEVLMTESAVDSAWVVSSGDRPAVHVLLTDAGRETFARITEENVGRLLAMVVDGGLMSAPLIRAPILQGRAIITGDFTLQEAGRIAEGLNK